MVNFGENGSIFKDNVWTTEQSEDNQAKTDWADTFGLVFDREEILPKIWKKYVARWKTTKCTKHSIKAIHTKLFWSNVKHP